MGKEEETVLEPAPPLSAKFAMGQVFRIVRFSHKKYDPKKYRTRQSCVIAEGWNYFGPQCKVDHTTFYHHHAHPTMDAPR
jgi:hypothetical protein